MFSRTRNAAWKTGLCIVIPISVCWSAAAAEAQYVHWHEHRHGCGPLPPVYAHNSFIFEVGPEYGVGPVYGVGSVWLPPVTPVWVAPPVGVATPFGVAPLNPDPLSMPRRPLAMEAPIQTENFAGDDVGVPLRGHADKPEVGSGALSEPGPFNDLDEIRRRVTVLKRSTPQGRARADRLISSGDASFRRQSYARAITQYRDAIARAPDYAEGHFRLAHAYVATRRLNLALKSAMTALELSGTARRNGFSLDELYQGNKFAREQHDAELFDAALREPADGGLQFLIGFTLHYDRQPLKAREYFRKANQLAGAHQAYLRHFVAIVPVAESNELAADAN